MTPFEIPPRLATDEHLADWGGHLAWTFDVDLGELCDGHHVVARGIEQTPQGASLHYEFVPGMTVGEQEERPFFWYWMAYASDDVGTEYDDTNGGAYDDRGGAASHGLRDLGGIVPSDARLLTLRFEPAPSWSPPGGSVRELTVDLRTGEATANT